MPPMIATPVAVPKGQEHESDSDQEFELDIRVSPVATQSVPSASVGHTCTCYTCHIIQGHCIQTENC